MPGSHPAWHGEKVGSAGEWKRQGERSGGEGAWAAANCSSRHTSGSRRSASRHERGTDAAGARKNIRGSRLGGVPTLMLSRSICPFRGPHTGLWNWHSPAGWPAAGVRTVLWAGGNTTVLRCNHSRALSRRSARQAGPAPTHAPAAKPTSDQQACGVGAVRRGQPLHVVGEARGEGDAL